MQGLIALGVMEELGFGLDRVAAALQAEGLPLPDFVESDGSFIVTVRGHGRDLLTDGAARERQPVPPAGGAGSARRKQEQRQAWALERMRTVGPLTARDYATALGVSPNTALRDLRDLVSRGLAVASGTTNDRRYALRIDASS